MSDAEYDALAKRLAGQTEKLAGDLRAAAENAAKQLNEQADAMLKELLLGESTSVPDKPTTEPPK